ncbi:MAG: SLC13 family permease [Dehalococcoidales bacterium]|nr:SLC13 family permease [Dehalococcoidales bacterium]
MSIRRWIGPGLGIVFLLVFLILPPSEPLTVAGMRTLGIFLFTVIWWATVGIGYPSFICIALLAITGVMTPQAVFAASWGNYLVIFILAVFGIAQCLKLTGFSRRFAFWFLTRPFTEGHPWLTIAMFLLGSLFLGSIMSGTATCIAFMAIAEPMIETLGYKKGDRFAATLMMGIAWAATAAFVMTPIGHASNVMLIDWLMVDTGYSMGFPEWMAIGVPTGLLFFLLILGYIRFIIRPDISKFSSDAIDYMRQEKNKIGPMKSEEKITVLVFLLVVALWMLPGLAGNLMPGISNYVNGLGFAIPPILGACLLCVIRIKDQPLMTFQKWMAGVPWETISLIAAIMVIRDVLGSPDTGIPQLLGNIFQPLASSAPFFVYMAIGQVWVSIQTNIMSNMVSACLVYKALVPAAISSGVGNAVALGFTIFAGARAGFALPSATTNTALITGGGWVPVGFMVRHGFAVTIGIVLVCIFIVYPLASIFYQ